MDGLRTLCIALREITDKKELQEWGNQYIELMGSVGPAKEENINKHAQQMEKDWKMLAVTAIEDKLQEQVAPSISQLRQAGIAVWMLTGDKKETAINIGYSCGLLDKEGKTYFLDVNDPDKLDAKLNEINGDLAQSPENQKN